MFVMLVEIKVKDMVERGLVFYFLGGSLNICICNVGLILLEYYGDVMSN